MNDKQNLVRANSDATAPEEAAESENQPTRLLFNPLIDIYETNDGLVLYADLPGVNAEGLDLQIQDNRLALFGRVKTPANGHDVIHEEYKVGDFLRSFILSDDVDHERITARLNNGVLRVELPRASCTEPRRIEVSTE